MGIDVVMFLQKMKIELADFTMDIVGAKNPTPPQYFTSIDMTLHIGGKKIDPRKVDRAVLLSHEKYCSVYNSLRKDMRMNIKYLIENRESSVSEFESGPD